MSSEMTAAAAGTVGKLRFDPFAMLPFCGYNMGDYFAHWLEVGRGGGSRGAAADLLRQLVPQGTDGKFLWPGFGENSRVLAWIFERCAGSAEAVETPIGLMPVEGGIDTDGLGIGAEEMAELLAVDEDQWRAQLPQFREHYAKFDALPETLADQLAALEARLG